MFETVLGEHFELMTFRLILAACLCGIIGFEREIKNHSAGFRTHILVGVSACLMMLLSLYGFEQYLDKFETIRFDPARIPSYVISGIGFLGAGTIMVHGMTIRGLTTAASIWTVAGLGLVIGAGMYGPALLTTIVVLLSLIFLNQFENRLAKNKKSDRKIRLILNQEAKLNNLLKIFDDFHLRIKRVEVNHKDNDERFLMVELEKGQQFDRNHLLDYLTKVKNVTYIYDKH
ncbi:putative Mg2+ transporter-C (MgtC) family protein [Salinibacillus kushneri]|uniref:Putative Mg2+ transporter-C (MgtC) family protein n=1 Tax=Salinibacillus kushneri TaxID=237682 RepID=A0A1I0IUJ8_9BACI|nr:MgtC/SapB family protein [Salinibacillus kushneri]SEU00254.1 putative Mg2+ transporter-C (MgtC) family protein [Salinibacillus kushneri]